MRKLQVLLLALIVSVAVFSCQTEETELPQKQELTEHLDFLSSLKGERLKLNGANLDPYCNYSGTNSAGDYVTVYIEKDSNTGIFYRTVTTYWDNGTSTSKQKIEFVEAFFECNLPF